MGLAFWKNKNKINYPPKILFFFFYLHTFFPNAKAVIAMSYRIYSFEAIFTIVLRKWLHIANSLDISQCASNNA